MTKEKFGNIPYGEQGVPLVLRDQKYIDEVRLDYFDKCRNIR